jgi:hypothetical protein
MNLIPKVNATIKTALILIELFTVINSAAQEDEFIYSDLVAKGMGYYNKKDYLNAATTLSKAFDIVVKKYSGYGDVRYESAYNEACSWALIGKPDSAFAALNKIIPTGRFTNIDMMLNDRDLLSLHQDVRWTELSNMVKANKTLSEATLDRELVEKLKVIREDDQKYRNIYDALRKRRDTSGTAFEIQTTLTLMRYRDSIDLISITHILDTYGWLGPEKIGFMGTQTLFLVIQHSRLNVQEKYLPMMREAVKEGKALAKDLAFLEDRVALRQGKKQLYGSQTWLDRCDGKIYVQPVEDPENLDKRRAAVWLEPMSEYIGYTWDPAAYIKNLAEIERKMKKQ